MTSAKFLYNQVTVFPFVIGKCLEGDALSLCKCHAYSQILPTNFPTLQWNLPIKIITLVVAHRQFLTSILSFSFINWNSSVKNSFLCFLLMYPIMYLYQLGPVDMYFVLRKVCKRDSKVFTNIKIYCQLEVRMWAMCM